MKTPQVKKPSGFTLIELLVVISIIAILASIAVPVFGGIQERGAQTKAMANAKQVGLACKLFAQDWNGNYPAWSDVDKKSPPGNDSNSVLQTLIPDYLADKTMFQVPKSAYCKNTGKGGSTSTKLSKGENEWAYVVGLTDTSNARFPLIADGFAPGTVNYIADDAKPGGVWKGKKAIVVRADASANVETTYRKGEAGSATAKYTVRRSDDDPQKNAFEKDPSANPPWLSGEDMKILNPGAP